MSPRVHTLATLQTQVWAKYQTKITLLPQRSQPKSVSPLSTHQCQRNVKWLLPFRSIILESLGTASFVMTMFSLVSLYVHRNWRFIRDRSPGHTSTFTQLLSSACNNNSSHFLVLYLPKGEHTTFCKTNNSVNYKRFAFPSHHSHSPAWVHRKNVTAREEKVVFFVCFVFFFGGRLGGGGGGGGWEGAWGFWNSSSHNSSKSVLWTNYKNKRKIYILKKKKKRNSDLPWWM